MFETAELGQKVPKQAFKARERELRHALLMAQQRLKKAEFSVIVLFGGVDGAGKSETANLLNTWMDPRWIKTCAFGPPTQDELERPPYWRFWQNLPPRGHIGILLSAWYTQPLLNRVHGGSLEDLEAALAEIETFETMLAQSGTLILKFWMHLGKDAQKRRFKKLEKDPLQSWRVTAQDWEHWELYDKFVTAAERIISKTSTGHAPWFIVEGADSNYRSLRVGEILLEHLEAVLQREVLENTPSVAEPGASPSGNGVLNPVTVLDQLDLSTSLDAKGYRKQLRQLQGRLNQLHRELQSAQRSSLIVFEGWDGAGKGGAIRRVVAALDASWLRVYSVAAPTDEEALYHYLWRFWRGLPRQGEMALFDRSWYGRVLVERIEGFAQEHEWRRAYAEINEFERQLVDFGTVLLKYWLHIDPDEQLQRFRVREKTPYKRWKLTDEDWRNRERWADHAQAAHDMVERTSTPAAPWTLVEANDKRYARIKVLATLCERLEKALG